MAKRSSIKREAIRTGRNKASAKRDGQGRSKHTDDVVLSADRTTAKTKCGPPGQK